MSTSFFDRDFSELDKSVTNGIRATFGISGVLSLLIGVAILVWPGKSAVVTAAIIAIYAIIAGVVNLVIGIFSRKIGAWPRVGYLLLGVLFLVAAVIALMNLTSATAVLAVLIGVMVGIVWIIEGIVGLTMMGDSSSKAWTILYAVVSILAGIVLIISPLWATAFLWLLLGVALIVLGIVQVVRAFRFGAK